MDLNEVLNGLTDDLEPIRALADRLASIGGRSELSESIRLSHRPVIGSEAFALNLYPPLTVEIIERYEGIHNIKVSPHYLPILRKLNGIHAFQLSLYGVPQSMARVPPLVDRSALQPFDLATANIYWRKGYAINGVFFHFGSGPYSREENVGYFFDEAGRVRAFTKKGTPIETWDSFGSFIRDELRRAEQSYPSFESFMNEVRQDLGRKNRKS